MKINIKIPLALSAIVLSAAFSAGPLDAQVLKGSVQGRVTDSTGAVLQGASVSVTPGGARTATTTEGDFTVAGLIPGAYTVTVDFVGFKLFTQQVAVTAGETMRLNVQLDVAGQSEQILVAAERPRGEAEQLNRERTADNIVQVLSSEVITSLPNANVADALGRLPSVTL